jgi:hypothetical protein
MEKLRDAAYMLRACHDPLPIHHTRRSTPSLKARLTLRRSGKGGNTSKTISLARWARWSDFMLCMHVRITMTTS